jgi:hypothetical protein
MYISDGWNTVQYLSNSNVDIINMSWGIDDWENPDSANEIGVTNLSWVISQYQIDPTILLTKAVSNAETPVSWDCTDLSSCGAHEMAMLRTIPDQTILVGAINADRELTSQKAGLMKDHYIVADGTGVFGTYGTSFAAPKVAGAAAILMHKFPSLQRNPKNTKEVLLKTADDLGAPGVDDIYGHGELNLKSALSPIGTLR